MNGKSAEIEYVAKNVLENFSNKIENVEFENEIAGTTKVSQMQTDLSKVIVLSPEVLAMLEDERYFMSSKEYLKEELELDEDERSIPADDLKKMYFKACNNFENIICTYIESDYLSDNVRSYIEDSKNLTVIDGRVLDRFLVDVKKIVSGMMFTYVFYYNEAEGDYDYFSDDGGMRLFERELKSALGDNCLGFDWLMATDMVVNDSRLSFLQKMLFVNSVGLATRMAIEHDDEMCFYEQEMSEFFGIIQSNINRNHPEQSKQTELLIDGLRAIVEKCVVRHLVNINTELSLK